MSIKRAVPKDIRRELQQKKRSLLDLFRGYRFARTGTHSLSVTAVSVEQKIKGTSFVENKISNIRLASGLVESVVVRPGEIFSFWRAVGKPSEKRGFKEGRTLHGGEVVPDIGGGLCQLSGIIYHAALQAGMEILERHNHSVDLYRECERFAPLGSDATVAYGYKDLRFRNSSDTPLAFRFRVSERSVLCEMVSERALPLRSVAFVRMEEDHHISVRSIDRETREELACSFYKKLR